MSSFSPTDAALEGVRLTREQPKALFIWAAYYFGFTLVMGVLAYLTLGPHAEDLLAAAQSTQSDPAEFGRVVAQTWPFFALALPLGLAFQATFTAAIYRVVLDGSPIAHLRVGRDELRLLALNLISMTIWLGVLFVVILVFISTATAASSSGAAFVTFIGTLANVGAFVGAIYLFVRLSLSGPATFSQSRLMVLRSWPLTHGHFWRLLGTYVMAFAVGIVVLLLMLFLFGALFEVLRMVTGVQAVSLTAAATSPPVFIVALAWQAVTCLMITCYYVIILAPSAQAYRSLTAPGTTAAVTA